MCREIYLENIWLPYTFKRLDDMQPAYAWGGGILYSNGGRKLQALQIIAATAADNFHNKT